MRTKSFKINGKSFEAILMAGGPGFKIYHYSEGLIVDKGREKVLISENDPNFKTVMGYVNLRYHNLNTQEKLKSDFQSFLKGNPEKKRKSSIKSFTTTKLKEILDEPYLRGKDYGKGKFQGGVDYGAKYGREELQNELWSRELKQDEKKQRKIEREFMAREKSIDRSGFVPSKPEKRMGIKIKWDVYKALGQEYAYLEMPDFPFYNVKVYEEKDGFLVLIGDGYKVKSEKSFKKIDDAFDYAEKEFLKMGKDDKDYKVSISKSNPSWASDEDIWEKAKKQSLKSYGRISYPFVVYLYKQMGGKVKKKK